MRFSTEKREKRAALVAQARALIDGAEAEKRELLAEEESQYEALMADVDRLKGEIDREEQRSARLDTVQSELEQRAAPVQIRPDLRPHEIQHRKSEFRSFLRSAPSGSEWEFRALQADSMTAGGATFAEEQFVANFIKNIDNQVFIRQKATVYKLTQSDSLGVPTLSARASAPTWTYELGIGDEDSTMAFGKRSLTTHPLAKYIKVSQKLLGISAIDIEQLVMSELAYAFAITEENAFLNGTGAGQPLGMFVASADGITTARDTTSTVSASVAADDFITVLYSLKPQYVAESTWICHRDLMAKIRKLKTGSGEYLWAPGLSSGSSLAVNGADTLLGRPIIVSEYAPSTFSTTCYIAVLGALRHYWIAESLSMRMQRLVELYAATNQVGFVLRGELDGQPVLDEAFARLKLL